jgi:hypothetical protein
MEQGQRRPAQEESARDQVMDVHWPILWSRGRGATNPWYVRTEGRAGSASMVEVEQPQEDLDADE